MELLNNSLTNKDAKSYIEKALKSKDFPKAYQLIITHKHLFNQFDIDDLQAELIDSMELCDNIEDIKFVE